MPRSDRPIPRDQLPERFPLQSLSGPIELSMKPATSHPEGLELDEPDPSADSLERPHPPAFLRFRPSRREMIRFSSGTAYPWFLASKTPSGVS